MNWLKRALQRWLEIEPRMTVSTTYANEWVWPEAMIWMDEYDEQTGEYTRKQ